MGAFDNELIEKHEKIFSGFFNNKDELMKFVLQMLDYKANNIPRRMINSIERLVSLSDDVDKIRKQRESLKLFFLVVCIETLYILMLENQNRRMRKIDMVIDFFENYISDIDKENIIQSININYKNKGQKELQIIKQITMEMVALMVYEIRNSFVHEGNYWEFTFSRKNVSYINLLSSKLTKDGYREDLVYSMGITFQEFRAICVRGFISFIQDYYNRYCMNN